MGVMQNTRPSYQEGTNNDRNNKGFNNNKLQHKKERADAEHVS